MRRDDGRASKQAGEQESEYFAQRPARRCGSNDAKCEFSGELLIGLLNVAVVKRSKSNICNDYCCPRELGRLNSCQAFNGAAAPPRRNGWQIHIQFVLPVLCSVHCLNRPVTFKDSPNMYSADNLLRSRVLCRRIMSYEKPPFSR